MEWSPCASDTTLLLLRYMYGCTFVDMCHVIALATVTFSITYNVMHNACLDLIHVVIFISVNH